MGIDVVDIFRRNPGITNSLVHRPLSPRSIHLGCGDMIGIPAHPITDDFGINLGPSVFRRFQFLQKKDACPFGHDKSVPVLVEGTGCSLWIIVACGKGSHRTESGNPKRGQRGFRSAGNHSVRIAPGNNPEGITNGVRTRRTCRTSGRIGPCCPEPNRDLP